MKTVCLVGRPNTGKSSLFNRLIKQRKAIISDMPGVTRDRLYGHVEYNNKVFRLIDTGGIDLENADFNENIKMQAEIGIEEADIILFVVDGREDLTLNDKAITSMLMKTNKRVILVINKIDDPYSLLQQKSLLDFKKVLNRIDMELIKNKEIRKENTE